MTSRPSWRRDLLQALARATPPDRPPRLAVVGVGNSLRGDDGCGPAVVRRLRSRVPSSACLLVDAGAIPESCTGPLRRWRPEVVVLVDAADLGEEPGTIRWLEPGALDACGVATHGLPLSVVARYLAEQTACTVGILAVQVECTAFDAAISAPVRRAVRRLADGLSRVQPSAR